MPRKPVPLLTKNIDEAAAEFRGYSRAQADVRSGRDAYSNIDTNISVRNTFTRQDYENFRPEESTPKTQRGKMFYANDAYHNVGLVRNIIDLMGDFCVQGIKLTHPDPDIQDAYNAWWAKINGDHVSERFANTFYRLATVVVHRRTARITVPEQRSMLALAEDRKLEPDTIKSPELKTVKKNIPWSYSILNPMSLEMVGGELSQFIGEQIIALRVSYNLVRKITAPKDDFERSLVAKLPASIVEPIKAGARLVALDADKISTFFYKKDDWMEFPDPMICAIQTDLDELAKMKLADMAALDGAISQVRIWKLGNLDKGLFPTDAAIEKLNAILLSNPGGGVFDLIWGPDLEFKEFSSEISTFLGGAKYEPVLRAIYEGLGVPPTLTGTTGASGTTNNFISLKTLLQRLDYGRKALKRFWNQEIELFRQAMSLKIGAEVQFDRMTLTDEAAEKALLIQLWDRDLVSDEIVVDRMGEEPFIELMRKKRENRERKSGKRSPKVGPYVQTEKLHDYLKLALQGGLINAEDVGIEVLDKENTPHAQKMKQDAEITKQKIAAKPKGVAGQGRPAGKKDGKKRKNKAFKPKSGASSASPSADFIVKNIWAAEALKSISEIVTPVMLEKFGKSTVRSLSESEFETVEGVKFLVLSQLEPYTEVSEEVVAGILVEQPKLEQGFAALFGKFMEKASAKKNLTVDNIRSIRACVYSILK